MDYDFIGDADNETVVKTFTVANSDSGYQPILVLKTSGRMGKLVATVMLGAGGSPLSHLQLTQAARVGGIHKPVYTDADFNAASSKVPVVVSSQGATPNPHTTPADGWFQIEVDLTGSHEVGLWCKGDGAVVTVEASVS